jgi:hypothetical protein
MNRRQRTFFLGIILTAISLSVQFKDVSFCHLIVTALTPGVTCSLIATKFRQKLPTKADIWKKYASNAQMAFKRLISQALNSCKQTGVRQRVCK